MDNKAECFQMEIPWIFSVGVKKRRGKYGSEKYTERKIYRRENAEEEK